MRSPWGFDFHRMVNPSDARQPFWKMNERILQLIDEYTIGDPSWDVMFLAHRLRERERLARVVSEFIESQIAEVIDDYEPDEWP